MRSKSIVVGFLMASACGEPNTTGMTGASGMTGTTAASGVTETTAVSGGTGTTAASGVTETSFGSTSTGAPSGCGSESPEALMLCVDRGRYIADVTAVALERTPGSAHWSTVQERCAASLEEAGFVVDLDD